MGSTNDIETLEAIVGLSDLWTKFYFEITTVVGCYFNNHIDDLSRTKGSKVKRLCSLYIKIDKLLGQQSMCQ